MDASGQNSGTLSEDFKRAYERALKKANLSEDEELIDHIINSHNAVANLSKQNMALQEQLRACKKKLEFNENTLFEKGVCWLLNDQGQKVEAICFECSKKEGKPIPVSLGKGPPDIYACPLNTEHRFPVYPDP